MGSLRCRRHETLVWTLITTLTISTTALHFAVRASNFIASARRSTPRKRYVARSIRHFRHLPAFLQNGAAVWLLALWSNGINVDIWQRQRLFFHINYLILNFYSYLHDILATCSQPLQTTRTTITRQVQAITQAAVALAHLPTVALRFGHLLHQSLHHHHHHLHLHFLQTTPTLLHLGVAHFCPHEGLGPMGSSCCRRHKHAEDVSQSRRNGSKRPTERSQAYTHDTRADPTRALFTRASSLSSPSFGGHYTTAL
jgi:hypothetical protein